MTDTNGMKLSEFNFDGAGYTWTDPDGIFAMVYDKNGKYLGQFQDNMLEDGLVFISATVDKDGNPAVGGGLGESRAIAPLTPDFMQQVRDLSAFGKTNWMTV